MVKPVQSPPMSNTTSIFQGCITLPIIGFLIYGINSCGRVKEKSPEQIKLEAAATAKDRFKGFHCLSQFDGSNTSLVGAVKRGLREPSSFEHIDTSISPADSEGLHHTTMEYRARNGFGGMTVGIASGEVDKDTCTASRIKVD